MDDDAWTDEVEAEADGSADAYRRRIRGLSMTPTDDQTSAYYTWWFNAGGCRSGGRASPRTNPTKSRAARLGAVLGNVT